MGLFSKLFGRRATITQDFEMIVYNIINCLPSMVKTLLKTGRNLFASSLQMSHGPKHIEDLEEVNLSILAYLVLWVEKQISDRGYLASCGHFEDFQNLLHARLIPKGQFEYFFERKFDWQSLLEKSQEAVLDAFSHFLLDHYYGAGWEETISFTDVYDIKFCTEIVHSLMVFDTRQITASAFRDKEAAQHFTELYENVSNKYLEPK